MIIGMGFAPAMLPLGMDFDKSVGRVSGLQTKVWLGKWD